MAWFEHPAGRIYYEESGSGDPVLVLPGWSGTIDGLAPLRQALAANFKVIAADLPGSGKSEPQPRDYPPTFYQDDARAFLAMLEARDTRPAHIVGYSDGGEYALLIAALQPEIVRSIVTWGAAGQVPNSPELADLFSNVVDNPDPSLHEFSQYLKATYGEANARTMAQSFGSAIRAIMEAGGEISRRRAEDISCAALLIAGEHDNITSPALVSEMAGAITDGAYVEVQGAGHGVHHERLEWLTDTIIEWLSKH